MNDSPDPEQTTNEQVAVPGESTSPQYSLWQIVAYALKLGSIGFGGPIAPVGYMHRDLVEHRQWISEQEYNEGMTLSQIAPGPLAAQLAIYLGDVHYGLLGARLVGIAFVLPSFAMVVALGCRYGGLSWMQAVFYGVEACVIGIITISAHNIDAKKRQGSIALVHFYCYCCRHRYS
jgi:chromate transporter